MAKIKLEGRYEILTAGTDEGGFEIHQWNNGEDNMVSATTEEARWLSARLLEWAGEE